MSTGACRVIGGGGGDAGGCLCCLWLVKLHILVKWGCVLASTCYHRSRCQKITQKHTQSINPASRLQFPSTWWAASPAVN